MGFRQELVKRIKKKELEISELKSQLDKAEAYLQGLNDSFRLLPKEDGDITAESKLRANSDLAKARDVLKQSGKPLHITKLLEAMGKPITKSSRVSLSGSLSAYARKGEIFTRPAPNTFGLKEMESTAENEVDSNHNEPHALPLEDGQ